MQKGAKLLNTVVVVLLFLIIVIYAGYRTKDMITGPVLVVSFPSSGMTFDESLIEVRGEVKNASSITMNDRQIFVNEEGKFKEDFLLSEGYNEVEVEIKDKFDRVRREVLKLVYQPKD